MQKKISGVRPNFGENRPPSLPSIYINLKEREVVPEPSLIPPRVVDKGSAAEELASSGPEEDFKA